MSVKNEDKGNVLYRMAMACFGKTRLTALVLAVLILSGAIVYNNLIKREGFPAIQFPVSFITGTYLVNDVDKVDKDIAIPISQLLADNSDVDKVQTASQSNFYSVIVQFNEGVSADIAIQSVKNKIESENILPSEADTTYTVIDPASYLNEFDLLLSVYSTNSAKVSQLEEAGEYVADKFKNSEKISDAKLISQLSTGSNPVTGEQTTVQTNFNRIGLRDNDGELKFYPSITVGVVKTEDIDIIGLSERTEEIIASLDYAVLSDDIVVVAGADQAETIDTQVSSLQSNLLTGLLAVALVSFLLITWRASIITAIFMVSVVLVSVLLLFLFGYTLNTITLFALVLSLGLFVDDATIVVEAIDANRKNNKSKNEIVGKALRKVAAASFAGTMTTVLVFAPLLFISDILGEFIRLLPITVVIALITSLVLSLTLIPLLSRFIILRTDDVSWITKVNPVSKFENYIAEKLASIIKSLKRNNKRKFFFPLGAFVLSGLFLLGTGFFASKISTNIFPPTKDSDQLGYTLNFAPGTDIEKAQEITDDANDIAKEVLGENVVRITFGSAGFSGGEPSSRSATSLVELISFNDREIKSPELIRQLEDGFSEGLSRGEVSASVNQIDAGPPSEKFPFKVQIYSEQTETSSKLASDMQEFLKGVTIEVPGKENAEVTDTKIDFADIIVRNEGRRFFELSASYDSDEVTTLLEDTKSQLNSEFNNDKLAAYGFSPEDITFDFGQESENQDSFSSLGIIFPLALTLMFILLTLQFRSLLQPLLIFIAIPFSLFGVMAGLFATDNGFSFFVVVGLIGLIGIAVNNTILLTDYINQERRNGLRPIDAVASASEKRFRPLLTTSLTTVVALLPLAMSDPFWEALAYTIMFGLLSSTFLVIVAFPYYYLAAEWLRIKVSRKKNTVS